MGERYDLVIYTHTTGYLGGIMLLDSSVVFIWPRISLVPFPIPTLLIIERLNHESGKKR